MPLSVPRKILENFGSGNWSESCLNFVLCKRVSGCLLLFCPFAFQDSCRPSKIPLVNDKVLEKVLDFCVNKSGNPDYTAWHVSTRNVECFFCRTFCENWFMTLNVIASSFLTFSIISAGDLRDWQNWSIVSDGQSSRFLCYQR